MIVTFRSGIGIVAVLADDIQAVAKFSVKTPSGEETIAHVVVRAGGDVSQVIPTDEEPSEVAKRVAPMLEFLDPDADAVFVRPGYIRMIAPGPAGSIMFLRGLKDLQFHLRGTPDENTDLWAKATGDQRAGPVSTLQIVSGAIINGRPLGRS